MRTCACMPMRVRASIAFVVQHACGGGMLHINFQFDPTRLNRALGSGDLGMVIGLEPWEGFIFVLRF